MIPAGTSTDPNRSANVKFYIMVITILAFGLVSYIFNSIDGMENNFSIGSTTLINTKEKLETNNSRDGNTKVVHDHWDPFNNTNPYKSSFCPTATCLNSPLCVPCKRRHFFIVSTARSGSTTLLRMFNALPQMRLSGENHNTLWFISQLTNNLLENKPNLLKHPVDKESGPFAHNTIPKGSMGCIAQKITHNLNPPPLAVQKDKTVNMEEFDEGLILGFKTVRLHHEDVSPLEAAEFIKDHFPCSRILINYQTNVTHQYLSFKTTFNHANSTGDDHDEDDNDDDDDYGGPSMEDLKDINNFQEELHKHLDKSSQLINFDEWTKDVNILNNVVDWLGYENCRFEEIVHENNGGYATDKETVLSAGNKCRYPHV